MADSGEDVTDFLRRIKELGDQRDREDAERTRKLEEDILEGRRQREARRAERARSLSPEKHFNSGAHRALHSPPTLSDDIVNSPLITAAGIPKLEEIWGKEEDALARTPSPRNAPGSSRPVSKQYLPSADSFHATKFSLQNGTPTRSGTLSWQQRPESLAGTRGRPFSMATKQPSIEMPIDSRNDEPETSRADIARLLAAKEPTFFRQTADRGKGSAAYRKSQLEDSNTVDHTSSTRPSSRELHGLTKQSSLEPENFHGSDGSLNASTKANVGLTGHLPTSGLDDSPSTTMITPVEARGTNSRPGSRSSSPIKGVGSFVSSAMLRSDSMNKRWNAQPNSAAALNRSDSSARARRFNRTGSKDGNPFTSSIPRLENVATPPLDPPSAPAEGSRPGSRQNDTMNDASSRSRDRPDSPTRRPTTPSPDRHSITSPPLSPSKRWSPTKSKSSWLESALGKPDSPKSAPSPASRNQPAWLVDLNKNRQQRMSKDLSAHRFTEEMPKADEAHELNINDDVQIQQSKDQQTKDQQTTQMAKAPKPKPKPARLSEGLQENEHQDNSSEQAESVLAETQAREAELKKHKAQPITNHDSSSGKPRLGTPPTQKDFRSSLKSTPISLEKEQVEPEFKSAFGKLKPTQTQNYKAPDTLRDNITAGKAALSVTGGPQKSVHRDEFKESILERKKTMKDSVLDPDLLHKPKLSIQAKSDLIPEALTRRRALGRNENSGNVQSLVTDTKETSRLAERPVEPGQPGHLQAANVTSTARSLSETVSENKLATRFNPALASLIARGPGFGAGKSSPVDKQTADSTELTTSPNGIHSKEEPLGGAQLQHMTKARARGPKRRAPKTTAGKTALAKPAQTNIGMTSKQRAESPVGDVTCPHPSEQMPVAGTKPAILSSSRKVSTPTRSTTEIASTSKSSQLKQESPKDEPITDALTQTIVAKAIPSRALEPSKELWRRNISANDKRMAKSSSSSSDKSEQPMNISVKDATSRWGQKSEHALPKEIESASLQPPWPEATSKVNLQGEQASAAGPRSGPKMTLISDESLDKSKPDEKGHDGEQQRNASSGSTKSSSKSPGSQASDAGKILEDFFGEIPTRPKKISVDTQTILTTASPGDVKIKTIRKEVYEITADGKRTALATDQEHILYSESMYACTHVFCDQNGARYTEVYLWTGLSVSQSAVEDVQLFAKRIARDANGTLVILRQGKETTAFVQAVGGILITRLGSSRQAGTAQRPIMLCGRRYFGHVVFDEVEFALSSLTAGFAFICTAQVGKIFVWIGAGCHAEELGSARLIAMDLGPAARVVEVEEGKEGSDFLSQFPEPQRIPRSAEHWKQKPAYEKYRTRLYRVQEVAAADAAAPLNALWGALTRRPSHADAKVGEVRVEEIVPFAQYDLEEEHVYVLDAFFEMYILPGALSGPSRAAFAAALLFAQDYGMLAASLEDRPFVPVSTVVMSGAPRDMKASFRAWDDGRVDSSALMGGSGIGRRAPLKIMGLGAAIAALKVE